MKDKIKTWYSCLMAISGSGLIVYYLHWIFWIVWFLIIVWIVWTTPRLSKQDWRDLQKIIKEQGEDAAIKEYLARSKTKDAKLAAKAIEGLKQAKTIK